MRFLGVVAAFTCCVLLTCQAWSFQPVVSRDDSVVDSPYFKVRVAAARALTGRTDATSRRDLLALAADPHPLVRLSALHALRMDASQEARATLVAARSDTAPIIRSYARR